MRLGLCHARHAALSANHGRNALERHYRYGSRLFRDASLLDVHHVHDDPALQHLGKAHLQAQTSSGMLLFSFCWGMFVDLKS